MVHKFNKKINKSFVLLAGLISCLCTPLHAEDLLTVYRLALTNDPTYLASEAEMRANNEVVPQAFSKLLPFANGSVSTTGNDSELYQKQRFNTHSYAVNLSQPLFHLDYFSQLKQSTLQKQVGIITYGLRKQQLILRVAQVYFDLLASLDDLQFFKSQRTAFSKELEQAQQRFEVGLIAITEVHEAKAKRDLAIAREVFTQNLVANNKEKLIEIIGIDFQAVSPLKKEMTLHKPIPENQQLWIDAALNHNLALYIARKNACIAKYDILTARSGHVPTVEVQGRVERAKPGPGFFPHDKDEYTTKTVTLNMNIPLFQGGAIVSQTRQASAKLDQANREVDLQIRTRTSETLQAYRSIKSSISEVHALAQAVISNQSALNATRAAYEVGTRTILDVLTAETSLLSAQREYAQARYKYVLESLNLKSEAGSLNDEDVIEINQLLIQNMNQWPAQYLPVNYHIK
jgi:outer membrane protein